MAATPEETGDEHAPGRGRPGPFDEARLLTVGQAADLLGVAHVTLRQWIRAGRLATHLGTRGGLAVDLVRAGDLAALDPSVRERELPSASTIEPVDRAAPGRSAGLAAGSVAGSVVGPASGSDDSASGGTVPAAWAHELTRELERLRAELAGERARGRARAAALEDVERDLRRLLAAPRSFAESPGVPGGGAPVHAAPRATESIAARRTERSGLPLLALVPALVLGFVARPLLEPTEARVHASAGTESASTDSPPVSVTLPRAELAATIASFPADDAQRAEPSELDEPVATLDETPAALPIAEPDPDAADALRVATSGDFKGRLTARELYPLAYAAVAAPACAFGGHAADLGPCMGPPTVAGDGVAGTHRVDGVDCCRHHQLAQRLGGDVAQLTATAELARGEGVLPPLAAARIDRAVGQFLRARFGAWRAAGVDDAQGEGHRVQLDGEGRATVETWIELAQQDQADAASDGTRVERRELRLVLEVSDGAAGDVLLELVTLTSSSEVAAGGALAAPASDRPAAGTDR